MTAKLEHRGQQVDKNKEKPRALPNFPINFPKNSDQFLSLGQALKSLHARYNQIVDESPLLGVKYCYCLFLVDGREYSQLFFQPSPLPRSLMISKLRDANLQNLGFPES